MPRKKKKYNERLNLGVAPDGTCIRPWIRADSRAEFDALKRQAIRDAAMLRNPSGIRFGEYADKWYQIYKSHKSLSTQEMYATTIRHLEPLRMRQLKDVTASDLQGIINQHVYHPRTCELIKLTLKQIYKQAIKDGLVYPVNLAEDLELPKPHRREMRFITDAEMQKIAKCDFQPQDALYVETLRNTGMRPSEALALQWGDIDFAGQAIHVRRAFEYDHNQPIIKSTKTGKDRTVPISTAFAETLRNIPRNGIFVFLWRGQPFTRSAYAAMSKRILRLINEALGGSDTFNILGGLTMYSFRHTYATSVLYYHGVKEGLISTKKAAQIMGHSEQVFLERYTHIDDEKEKIAKLLDRITAVS